MIQILREAKKTPEEVERLVTLAGGRNRFGEPNFRVVWGWSRLAWIGGRWTDRDSEGGVVREVVELREVPKYFPFDRWHVERWMPPEAYGSPDAWDRETTETEGGIRVPALGPYPSRGDWEHCFTVETPEGQFQALTPSISDHVVRAIEWARSQPASKAREAIERAVQRREREYESFVDGMLWNEPRFHGQPYIVAKG